MSSAVRRSSEQSPNLSRANSGVIELNVVELEAMMGHTHVRVTKSQPAPATAAPRSVPPTAKIIDAEIVGPEEAVAMAIPPVVTPVEWRWKRAVNAYEQAAVATGSASVHSVA